MRRIYNALKQCELTVYRHFPHITPRLPEEITFIHAEKLLRKYPGMTATERETAAAKEYGAIFIIGIGAPLSNGEPHDGRAPDYDDWISPNSDGYSGLNGDIVLYDSILDRSCVN